MSAFTQGSVELDHLSESRVRAPARSGKSRLFLDSNGSLKIKRFDGSVVDVGVSDKDSKAGGVSLLEVAAIVRELSAFSEKSRSVVARIEDAEHRLLSDDGLAGEVKRLWGEMPRRELIDSLDARIKNITDTLEREVQDQDRLEAATDTLAKDLSTVTSSLSVIRARFIELGDKLDTALTDNHRIKNDLRPVADALARLDAAMPRDYITAVEVRSVSQGASASLKAEKVGSVVFLDITFPVSTRSGGGGSKGNGGSSTLSGLQDVDLDGLLPGQILVWDAVEEKWLPQDIPPVVMGGDVSGDATSATVVGIHSIPVSNAPTAGQRLVYNQAVNQLQWYNTLVYTSLAQAVTGQDAQVIGERIIVSNDPKDNECGTYTVVALSGDVADYSKKTDCTDTASEVGIVDAGGFYPDSDNVEEALQEAGPRLNGAATTTALPNAVMTTVDLITASQGGTSVIWEVSLFDATNERAGRWRVEATYIGNTTAFSVHGIGSSHGEVFEVALDDGNLLLKIQVVGATWVAIVTRTVVHRA